jgi:hypothetical protein
VANEARLNELLDLVEQARAEGDKETETKAIAAYRRESAPAQPEAVPPIGGMGNFNPMVSRLTADAQRGMNELGMTPENTKNINANVTGMFTEPAAQAATGFAAMPVAGWAGIGQGVFNTLFPDPSNTSAADRVGKVQNAITYKPRTGAGNAASRIIGLPAEALSVGTNYLGEKTTDATGSPAAGAFVKTAGDLAPALLMKRPTRGGRLIETEKAPTGEYVSRKHDVPTTEQLKSASQAAYKAGEESGVIVPAAGYSKTLGTVREMVTKEGIDPTLHPKSMAVMKRLEQAEGNPLSLQEAETLRKIALDAEDDLNPVTREPTPDARLASKIVDELDESIDALSVNDPARELWSRMRRSQMIDRAIHRAEIKAGAKYTQAGMEHALRTEFKQLALNPRRMRGLTAEQRAAIEKVAKGGPIENTLRALGKFDPTTGGVAAAASIGTGAGLSGVTGGASMLLPAAGFVSRRGATNLTARNVDRAREALVGRGLPPPPVQRPARGLLAEPVESLPFEQTPGVMPARAGILSQGLDFEQPPMPGAQTFPPAPARGLTADTPPPMGGGLPFRNYLPNDRAGNLELAPPAPRYPGGVDFSATRLPPQTQRAAPLGLLEDAPQPRSGGLLDGSTRGLADIRAEIQALDAEVKRLRAKGPAADTIRASAEAELARLRQELKVHESLAGSSRTTSKNPSR